jgi:hypothetical protein
MKTVRFEGDKRVRQVGEEWVDRGRRWRIVDGYGCYWLQSLWHVFVADEHQIRMGFVYHDGYPGPNRAWNNEPMSLRTFVGIKKPSIWGRVFLGGYERTSGYCIDVIRRMARSLPEVPTAYTGDEVVVA